MPSSFDLPCRPAIVAALACCLLPALAAGPAEEVNPFIGTGGHGHTHPAATLPFGMVQLGPDTRLEGWDGCSGYHDTDRVIYGFTHTHLSGTGIADYGDILLMPVTGAPRLVNGYPDDPDRGYASRFRKGTEHAAPGWYAVTLEDYGIGVELTATERTGWHRYRFPDGEPGHVIVDLAHRDRVLASSLRIVSATEIEGTRRSTGWARDQVVHFVARFSRPLDAVLAEGDRPRPGVTAVEGEDVKAILSLREPGGELVVKVGISAVDIAGARRNLEAESPGWDFDGAREAAGCRWDDALGTVRIEGGAPDQRTIFHTALYHSLLAPNLYSDVDGRYLGMDRRIHTAAGRRHYTVFSLWDTFRATHPLYTILEPGRVEEIVETFLAMYREGGRLPVWELAANETDTMIGYHAVPVIAEAWRKGIRGFDGEKALAAMRDSAGRDHFGLEAYRRQGFIGGEDAAESVSRTLEYAYDDACIASMASDLGHEDLAATFRRRSQAWRHLLDPETGFMRPRRNQAWIEPFDPRQVDVNFTEANSWQYSFFVPHDVEGLMEALGGAETFVERLDALFTADSRTTGREQADITGMIGQYAHGNEPSHHMAWLYHYAGRPGRSVARVHEILEELYTADADGLSGNEDCGQMSSWYVLSAAGLYAVSPCSGDWLLGVPIFDAVTFRVGEDRRFTIRTVGPRGPSSQVRRVTLDGRELMRSYLHHAEIAAGGELRIELGDGAGSGWGRGPENRPPSRIAGERVIAAPFVRSPERRFRDFLDVALETAEPGARIRFTRESGVEPDAWATYEKSLTLTDSAEIRFFAERDGRRSPVVAATFRRLPADWTVRLTDPPDPQYTAGGDLALIDGLRGGPSWRSGGWMGFRPAAFEATVDLGGSRELHRVGAGFLQDEASWIWLPAELIVFVSPDGREFREVGRTGHDVPDDAGGIVLRDLTVGLDGIEARHVRVRALPYGPIPRWHPGAGEPAWIFVDEMLID